MSVQRKLVLVLQKDSQKMGFNMMQVKIIFQRFENLVRCCYTDSNGLFTRNFFWRVSVITTIIKRVPFIVIRIAERKWIHPPMQSVIHSVAIGTILNFKKVVITDTIKKRYI